MDDLIEQARVNTETTAIAAVAIPPKDVEFARTGVKPENWAQAVAMPRPGGLSPENWAKVLRRVALAPTIENAEQLDAAFRKPGAGKLILDTLGVKMIESPKVAQPAGVNP